MDIEWCGGFDTFMNPVPDECGEMGAREQQNNIGMVGIQRNSLIMLEALNGA